MDIFKGLDFREDIDYKGIYYHDDLPFEVSEENGYLKLMVGLEYTVSENTIPATIDNLQNLIDTFNPK